MSQILQYNPMIIIITSELTNKGNYNIIGKLACPRVNDDQKIDVDDQKLNSGRPHDNQLISGDSLIYLG